MVTCSNGVGHLKYFFGRRREVGVGNKISPRKTIRTQPTPLPLRWHHLTREVYDTSMSFRKRNVGLSGSGRSPVAQTAPHDQAQLSGCRPSAVDGRAVTSTGTASLDALLAGHSGLSLGCTLLIEESGTTDYAGALLRFFAAEGLLQDHHVHVIGMPEHWGRELPGAVGDSDKKEKPAGSTEKMKIAWRYESLGQFGDSTNARGGQILPCSKARPNAIDSTMLSFSPVSFH